MSAAEVKKRIKPLGNTNPFIHMMLVAMPGGGKTVLAGTAPNALFITTDPEGTISAFAMGSKAKELEVLAWSDISDVYLYLKNGGIKELGVEWVIIDNVSEAQTFAMTATMEAARKQKPGLDEFVPTQQDYQRSQNMLTKMVRQFNDLPVNTIWTAWQAEAEDAEGETYFTPSIHGQKGQIAQQIAGWQNVIGYIQVVKKGDRQVRRVWFTHQGSYRGKDRYIALGRYMDDPTIGDIQSAIRTTVAARKAGKPVTTKTTGARRATGTRTTAARRRTTTKEK